MAAPGNWKVVSGHLKQLLVDGKVDHRYRVGFTAGNYDVNLVVDATKSSLSLGEYRDVVGKKIQVELASNAGNATASGTYDNLD